MTQENIISPPSLQLFRNQPEKKTLTQEQEEIIRLKKEKNAILLCHNYQIRAYTGSGRLCGGFSGPGQAGSINRCRYYRILRRPLHG